MPNASRNGYPAPVGDSRSPPGPGSLVIISSRMPSSGCSRMISRFGCHSAASAGKIENGSGAELDDDLGNLLRQPLAGAQVERHVGPAPGAHLGLQRDEGFGRGWLRRAQVGEIARHRLAVDRALACTGRAPSASAASCGSIGRSARSTFSFSSRTAIGVERHRRLHRDQAQQLQHVVLHHVAQRAGAVVVAGAALHARPSRPR